MPRFDLLIGPLVALLIIVALILVIFKLVDHPIVIQAITGA